MNMRFALVLGIALSLGGCGTFSEDGGLSAVRDATGLTPVRLRSAEDEHSARARIEPLLRKTLTADDAVQIALLNNRELQAAYNALGLSEADMVAAHLPPNPRFSIERLAGAGSVELEARVLANILSLATIPARADVARDRFTQAQSEAANATLRTAAQARRAYFRAVAAQSLVDFLSQSETAARSAAQLSAQLGESGSLNKLDQARNQVFYAELSGQLATAKARAASEREALVRAMGVWGDDLRFQLPAMLPRLPTQAARLPHVEAEAIRRRADLQIARLNVTALGKSYGLTEATRFVNLLEVAGISKTVRAGDEKERERGFEVEFEVPLFDFGQVRSRKAEETYLQAVNRLTAKAVQVRSEARDAYRTYRASYDIARHYQREVLPLRKIISDETLLRYNAMQIDVFALLVEARQRISATMTAIEAQRDFFLAQTTLGTAVLGGGADAGSSESQTASAPAAEAAGH